MGLFLWQLMDHPLLATCEGRMASRAYLGPTCPETVWPETDLLDIVGSDIMPPPTISRYCALGWGPIQASYIGPHESWGQPCIEGMPRDQRPTYYIAPRKCHCLTAEQTTGQGKSFKRNI